MALKRSTMYLWIIVLFASIIQSSAQSQSDDEWIHLSLKDLHYNDFTLNGLYGNTSIWIPIQSNWSVENDIDLEITYTASPLINTAEAALTVLANAQEITTIRPIGDGNEHNFVVSVPRELVFEDGFNLGFEGYLRLTEELCEDTDNTGQWLIIENASQVAIPLSPQVAPVDLSQLSRAIAVQGASVDIPPVTFVLPDNFNSTHLTVAGKVAARLGQEQTNIAQLLQFTTASEITNAEMEESSLIIIGELTEHPLITQIIEQFMDSSEDDGSNSLITDIEQADPESAIIMLFPSPWGLRRSSLIVSGKSPAGLELAGNVFENSSTYRSLTGNWEIVDSLITLPNPIDSLPWISNQTTFAQLDQLDRIVTGIGLTETLYFFDMPPGWKLEDGAQLTLHMAFSPVLRSGTSYITVHINEIYLGSIDIPEDDGDIWVAFDLPIRAMNELAKGANPQDLDIAISIFNLLPSDTCEQINAATSWTRIYGNSYFTIPHSYAMVPDLHAFPFPFVGDLESAPTTIVLPDNPSHIEAETALLIASILGEQGLDDVEVSLASGDFVIEEQTDPNLIIIGNREKLPLIDMLLETADEILVEEIYRALKKPQTGVIHALNPSSNDDRNILLVYSNFEDGLELLAETFQESTPPVAETGSVALVRENQRPLILYREVGVPQPSFIAPQLTRSEVDEQQDETGTATAEVELPSPTEVAIGEQIPITEPISSEDESTELSEEERIVLLITAFLVILVSLAALGRIIFRFTDS